MASRTGNSRSREVNDSYLKQVNVLKILGTNQQGVVRQYRIEEIAELSGLNDEKECQRHLYILEGHKLVAPYPEGDFTSKTWRITQQGISIIRSLTRHAMH